MIPIIIIISCAIILTIFAIYKKRESAFSNDEEEFNLLFDTSDMNCGGFVEGSIDDYLESKEPKEPLRLDSKSAEIDIERYREIVFDKERYKQRGGYTYGR